MQDKKSSTTLTFRLPTDLRTALDRAAESERRTLANLTILMIEKGLAERGFWPVTKPAEKTGRSGRKGA